MRSQSDFINELEVRQANIEGARVENVRERDFLKVSNPEAMVRSHVMDCQPQWVND